VSRPEHQKEPGNLQEAVVWPHRRERTRE